MICKFENEKYRVELQKDEVCDATGDDSSNADRLIKY